VPEHRLFPSPYCVDNEGLQGEARRLAPERELIRQRLGVGGADPVILFVGKLTPKKDPLTLIEAFRQIRNALSCRLLVVGEGPLEAEMRQRVAAANLTGVTFAGFLNRAEIPAAYAAADVFCLPSVLNETWGLVVNEAMNFSLPLVVSDKVGSAKDLVKEGVNGHIVPPGDPTALAAALTSLVANPDQRRLYGEQSLRIVSAWHFGLAVEGIVAAATAASGRATPGQPIVAPD
jgi:glycosyltransferase involved in cell wall biosynthesis